MATRCIVEGCGRRPQTEDVELEGRPGIERPTCNDTRARPHGTVLPVAAEQHRRAKLTQNAGLWLKRARGAGRFSNSAGVVSPLSHQPKYSPRT